MVHAPESCICITNHMRIIVFRIQRKFGTRNQFSKMGIAYMFNTVTPSAYEQLPSPLLTVEWLKVLYKSHTKLQITDSHKSSNY